VADRVVVGIARRVVVGMARRVVVARPVDVVLTGSVVVICPPFCFRELFPFFVILCKRFTTFAILIIDNKLLV